MTTLDDAWRWYQATRRQLRVVRRLGEKHWDEMPWAGPLGRDAFFRDLSAGQIVADATVGLTPLDDLAVVVLFSVFEAAVRETVLTGIAGEADRLQHPTLKHAAEEAATAIKEGSFFRVLEPFKAEGHVELVGPFVSRAPVQWRLRRPAAWRGRPQ